jgi:cyclohexa-1,5-dienecarbonyl-CoA hydratase
VPTVEVTKEQGVARVTLNNPPVNVIDLPTARELARRLAEVRRLEGLTAVVLRGHGRTFCAGVDVRDHLPDRGGEMLHEFHRACRLLLELPVPVVAAVQGPALGGGCELTLMCDLVVASERATFGQPEIKLGVFPPLASVVLPRVVGQHLASDMLLTGRVLGAPEAQRCGLVNRIAPEHELSVALESLLEELGALSPASLRLAKRAMRLTRQHPAPEEIDAAERLYVDELMPTVDAVEGLKAYLEKRPPKWRSP